MKLLYALIVVMAAACVSPGRSNADPDRPHLGLRPRLELSDEAWPPRAIPEPVIDRSSSAFLFSVGGLLAGLSISGLIARGRGRRFRTALSRLKADQEQLLVHTGDVVIRLSGSSASTSASIQDLVGYTDDEMRSIPMADLVHPDDIDDVLATFASVRLGGQSVRTRYRVRHRDGSTKWVAGTFASSGDETASIVVVIRDITESIRKEEEMRAATAAAEASRRIAEEAVRTKSDFLATMSHEIRTPLNAILGFADLLLGTHDLAVPARRNVERIKAGGDALLTVVGDILDVSQAENGTLRLNPRPFALPLLVDECIALVQTSAVAKNLSLSVDLVDRFPTGLMGDEARIRQVLLNLLANAIKFTRSGGVSVRIGYDRQVGADRVMFAVTDTGIGIGPEDIPTLFQRFRQVDSTIRRIYGGTGLGLAISKSLVELMGGTIGVESKLGSGSTFRFSIDLPRAALVLETETVRDRVETSFSILLVEDVPINQELARAILETRGHRVDVVADGADAIMAATDTAYDLVLMDVQMPFVDGFTATRAIRALPAPACHVPIVAMTANVLREHIAEARRAGMNDFLPKPISIELLLEVVDRNASGARRGQTAGGKPTVR